MRIQDTSSQSAAVKREVLKRKIMLHYMNLMKQRYQYENVPKEIPNGAIEEYIFKYDTFAFSTSTIAKYEHVLYGGNIGSSEIDPYGRIIRANCTLTGTYVNYQKRVTNEIDGVFWQPEGQLSQSLYNQIEPYVEKMVDIYFSHLNNIKLSNSKLVVEAEEGAVKQAVTSAVESTDVANPFVVFDTSGMSMTDRLLNDELGLRALNFDVQYNPIAYYQDFKNTESKINNILGIEHNSSNKRERNNTEEVALDITETTDKQDYMFRIREDFIDKVNKTLGLNIKLKERERDVHNKSDIPGTGLNTDTEHME